MVVSNKDFSKGFTNARLVPVGLGSDIPRTPAESRRALIRLSLRFRLPHRCILYQQSIGSPAILHAFGVAIAFRSPNSLPQMAENSSDG